MSRTIFLYIFKDLLWIFLLASGALAGIMSFGGLLRPLTEHGLNAGQAVRMLSYFMPAMTTYSLPVAALFATTMVYGRLAADNELVACRAAGMSYFSVALPALVMGLTVALTSLLCLCFLVPVFTLKVERVIYSNLAQLIANQIERTHQIKFNDSTTIFAQEAAVAPQDPKRPREQIVTLGGLMIVSFEKDDSETPAGQSRLRIPREFYLARQATVLIRPGKSGDEFTFEARLLDGSVFPRRVSMRQSTQGGLVATEYGPVVISSLIKEDTKFMDIRHLHELHNDLARSRRVQEQLQKIFREQQEAELLKQVYADISNPGRSHRFEAAGETYELTAPKGVLSMHGGKMILMPGRLVQYRGGRPSLTAEAGEVQLSATALPDDRLTVQVELRGVTVDAGQGPIPKSAPFARNFIVPAPVTNDALAARGVAYYRWNETVPRDRRNALYREIVKIGNAIVSEIHSRLSFAFSCLILVMVGCFLGMMFKSGNFLSAFALSVMPALLCIALIVAGQHTATNVPYRIDPSFKNPLNLGLGLIWSGNAAALVLAAVLGTRLQRQ